MAKKPTEEMMQMRQEALVGYMRCQQGVSVLGLSIFCRVDKHDPELLNEIEKSIQEQGTLIPGNGDELLYDVIKSLLLLKMAVDELVAYSRSAYTVLMRKYKCKSGPMVSRGPELPEYSLASFEGIALYTSQLMTSFEDTMKDAGPILATNRSDGILALDVQEQFENMRTALVPVV